MSQPPVLLGSAHLRVTEFSVISVGLKLSGGPGLSVCRGRKFMKIFLSIEMFDKIIETMKGC